MTRRFTAHEPRPLRDARSKGSTPPGAKSEKPGKSKKPAKAKNPAEAKNPSPVGKSPVGKTAEIGGPSGPEPTRYGDWERKGICVDF